MSRLHYTERENLNFAEVPIPNTNSRILYLVSTVERDNYGNEVGKLVAVRARDNVKETLWEKEKDGLRADEGLIFETPAFIIFSRW